MQNLFPISAPTLALNLTTSASSAVALPARQTTLRLVNEGPNIAYLAVGTSQAGTVAAVPAANAALGCMPVPVGPVLEFSLPDDQVYWLSGICASGAARLDVSLAEGQ